MSSARCLNWSRPPPGRHPAVLRKQLSCGEPSPASHHLPGGGRSQSVTSTTAPGDTADFCHFLVTGAIIHANRLQTYHTYNQAHRGASASLLRSRPSLDIEDGGQQQQQQQQRRRPASASGLSTVDDRPTIRSGRRAILCKQLSLDRSILVASTIASGMATVASGGPLPLTVGSDRDELGEGWAFNRKPQQQQRTGPGGTRNDPEAATKKGLKSAKDSRINIKIFLGQTVQQDSSDTGISDTEGTAPTPAAPHQTSRPAEPSVTNMSTESACAAGGKGKATNGTAGNASSNVNQSGGGGTTSTAVSTGNNGAGGRTSSLAQRRAQFQANRQNSEAHDRRHPPLVRALSAPIRPADTEPSKFLQGKKKPRRRKVLREKDEHNICEEDEYSDDGGSKMAASLGAPGSHSMGPAGRPMPAACILPMRSRSVLGGPCDIETLVSLLSSGGSDSEKEQDSTQAPPGQQSPTGNGVTSSSVAAFRAQFSSAHLAKGRAPMLKKTGKSVSFQESDLKPAAATAGLNRDYRKPTFQPTVANRIRRTQQLVSTLNAFQLKDRDRREDKEKNESEDGGDSDHHNEDSSSPANTQTISSTSGGSSKADTKTAPSAVTASATGDLQTPKEQECYRLFLKMSKKGLAVSYDTILRGMLTPTELRVLQKKKSRQRNENGIESTGTDGNVSTGGESSPENGGVSFSEELQLHHGGGNVHLTIREEPLAVVDENGHEEEAKRGETNAY